MKKKKQNHHQGAENLDNNKRKELALKLISNDEPVTNISQEYDVSRKFLYAQKDKAMGAIEETFSEYESDKVLFYIPVTKSWIRQLTLSLALDCGASFRGIIKLCINMLQYNISIGTIHNILQDSVKSARVINNTKDISNIKASANDETFHLNKPILTGVDLDSLYCYLLSDEDTRDGETWAIHLLYLQDQGFNPDYTVADQGSGLRSGQAQVMPNVYCRGDLFIYVNY